MARIFRDSEGDLPSVHGALIEAPQAWSQQTTKFKTPHEYVVSALRLLDSVPEQPQQVLSSFLLLGQRPYSPGSPAGWPDRADQWDGPDALLKRIEWASVLGERLGSRFEPLDRAAHALGDALSGHTRTAISRAASAGQGMTLLLASPEFQGGREDDNRKERKDEGIRRNDESCSAQLRWPGRSVIQRSMRLRGYCDSDDNRRLACLRWRACDGLRHIRRATTDARFVLVILRGALDGLAAAPAYGDGGYASKRGELAITAPQHKLDGLFALHPSLTRSV